MNLNTPMYAWRFAAKFILVFIRLFYLVRSEYLLAFSPKVGASSRFKKKMGLRYVRNEG